MDVAVYKDNVATRDARAGIEMSEKAALAMQTKKQPQPIVDILGRVAWELTDLGHSVGALHGLVENIDPGHIVERHKFMHSAQAIDIIGQRLEGLSHFIVELGEIMPSHWAVESHSAAQNLKLSELAARLSHGAHNVPEHTATPGDSEFF